MRSKFDLRVSGYICAKSPFLVRSTLTNLEGSITTTTLGIPTLVVPRVVVPFDYQSRRGLKASSVDQPYRFKGV